MECFVTNIRLHRLANNETVDSDQFRDYLLELSAGGAQSAESCAAESVASVYQLDNNAALRYSVHLDCDSIRWRVSAHELNAKSDNSDNNNNNNDKSNNILQLCTLLSDIKLCYVNFEASNLIIWLLTKYPSRVDNNNEAQQQQPLADHQATGGNTIAIVCLCACEQDVIKLREAYKKLRSIKKFSSDGNFEKAINNKKLPAAASSSANITSSSSSSTTTTTTNWNTPRNETVDGSGRTRKQITTNQTIPKGQTTPNKQTQNNIHNRQRQPAKVIYEQCARATLLEPVGHYNKHGYVYAPRPKKYSESEFDPSQFENYLSPVEHRFASLKTRSRGRVRSRSMEPPPARRSRGPIHIRLRADGRPTIERESAGDRKDHDEMLSPAGKLISNDNFNSESSSLSDDSSTGDKFESSSSGGSSKVPSPIVKSALKKSKSHRDGDNNNIGSKPSSSFSSNIYAAAIFLNNSLFHLDRGNKNKKPIDSGYLTLKKNVTFSSYATIQVVDN